MAAPVFTLAKTKEMRLAGLAVVAGTFTSDGGDYAAGGFVPTPAFSSFDGALLRNPDIVLFQSYNGYKYEYDPSTGKILIRVATTAGTNAIEGEHTAVAVVAAARTGVNFVAIWLSGVNA